MKENVEKVIKIEMGYSEHVCNCGTCNWYKEVESKYVDREWIDLCIFNTLGEMIVKQSAHCHHWKQKIATQTL